jgi:hypothetical protein
MRVNPRTFPIFQKVMDGRIFEMEIDEGFEYEHSIPQIIDAINQLWPKIKKVYYVTKTFEQAFLKAFPKIFKDNKHIEYTTTNEEDVGIFLRDDGMTLYAFNVNLKGAVFSDCRASIFGFTRNALTSWMQMAKDGENMAGDWAWPKPEGPIPSEMAASIKEHLLGWSHSYLALYYFVHECETETVIVPPGKKHGDKVTGIYNESRTPIIHLDARWFTDIVRDIPYGVKGHWRWQPHGEGRTKRRMQWIAEFQKTGYHSKPRKDLNEAHESTN